MNANQDRVLLGRFMELLYQDLVDQPVITRTMEAIVRRLIDRLHSFASPAGFMPESLSELEASIDELFGSTLSTLKATSIHSNYDALASYKGYWQDGQLGPFFIHKNEQFLSRREGQQLLRVFACDSVASAVGEEWFNDTVIPQVKHGAAVKVIEIDPARVLTYEDFGIYEHQSGSDSAGNYLLLAPRDRNLEQDGLTTSVTADSGTVADYSRKFDILWAQSAAPLELLDSGRLDKAERRPLGRYGLGKVTDIFGRQVILRRMERLDTGERLDTSATGFVRKYQQPYAEAISNHLKLRFPSVRSVLYVGDTHKNDGGVIRNLQALNWDVSGFICSPDLGISRLWFQDILYTNSWTDLVGFADKVFGKAGPGTMALFDIDQTLWAPKGIHDRPLSNSRTRAMSRMIDGYVRDLDSDVAKHARARIGPLYREVSKVKYLPLTLDNEDFKAAICVFLSLNIVFDKHLLKSAGARIYEDLGRSDPDEFLDIVRKEYLPSFMRRAKDDDENIRRFLTETLAATYTSQYKSYGNANGILINAVVDHLQDIFQETAAAAPTQYHAFRAKELEEALSCVSGNGGFSEQLILNKPAWDVASWLKRRGAHLLALSDRPDESTVSADGNSLLDASMMVYGKNISDLLPED